MLSSLHRNNNDSDVEDAYDSLCNALREENGLDIAQKNRAVAKFITCSTHGDEGTLELLLKSGAEFSRPVLDVNLEESGWLPIHAACQMGFIEVSNFSTHHCGGAGAYFYEHLSVCLIYPSGLSSGLKKNWQF